MFWARTAALKPLLELKLTFEDFPEEDAQIDGTIAHAIERLYFFVAESTGFDWVKIAVPDFFSANTAIIRATSVSDLEAFSDTCLARLLDQEHLEEKTIRRPIASPNRGLLDQIQDRSLGHFVSRCITDVAIGLVTYNNEAPQLAAAVSSARIATASAGIKPRIFILDYGESSERAVPADADVLRIPSVGNIGFGAGHNKLMREAFAAGAEAYVAMNPDGALAPDAILSLLGVLSANGGEGPR